MKPDNYPDLDRILDSAIRQYSAGEPRPGFESRLMNRIKAADQPSPRWHWPRWIIALPALAGLLFLVLRVPFWRTPQPERSERAGVSARMPVPAVQPREQSAPARPAPKRRLRGPEFVRLPKRNVFPSNVGLSPEERALAALLAKDPQQAREWASETHPSGLEPLQIKAIEIEPIRNGG